MTDNATCSFGSGASRDCSRTSMWFTAGDGWDPADFWADCFEKTLCFSVEILDFAPQKN